MTDFGTLHYLTAGNPSLPAVVFLHGFLGSGSDWDEIIAVLSKEFYCVAPDLPGHGQTKGNSNPDAYSISGSANAVEATLDKSGITQCALVGYSMGGRLALYIALTHPQRWTRIVVESASPGIEGVAERAERQELDHKRAEELEKSDFEAFLESWYRQPLFESLKRDRARFDRLLERRRSNNPIELAKSLKGMSTGVQPSLWGSLPQLKMPLLVMSGELDPKYRQLGAEMSRLCQKAILTIVADAGHNAHAERPAEYAQQLGQFLRGKLR
jgi:2-succinyl-6-hydroxy-2,4-cyclohexadiene-1-carboxylate synthase